MRTEATLGHPGRVPEVSSDVRPSPAASSVSAVAIWLKSAARCAITQGGLRAAAGDSLAAALQIAGGGVGGAAGQGLVVTAQDAFVHAFQIGSVVTVAVASPGALLALLFLPARSRDEEPITITLEREPSWPSWNPPSSEARAERDEARRPQVRCF
jgi:hypothetical protein